MKTFKLLAIVVALATMAFASCEKGGTGPQGERGAQGEKGEKGDPGARGATGATGPKGDKAPGLGSSGHYQVRYFIYQFTASPSVYRLGIRTLKTDGTLPYGSPLTFRKIKVIFAEASQILAAQANGQLDLSDYQSVKKTLGIQD